MRGLALAPLLFCAACASGSTSSTASYWQDLEARAVFERAEAYYREGRHAQAIVEYRKYLDQGWDRAHGDDAAFRIAQSLEASGNRVEAADAYQATVKLFGRSSLAPEALLRAGAIYAIEGYADDGRSMYEWVLSDYGQSENAAEARRRLEAMGVAPEVIRTRRRIPHGGGREILLGHRTLGDPGADRTGDER